MKKVEKINWMKEANLYGFGLDATNFVNALVEAVEELQETQLLLAEKMYELEQIMLSKEKGGEVNHLNLDQCEKLRDLGYPQDTSFLVRVINHTTTPDAPLMVRHTLNRKYTKSEQKQLLWVACPTLEELIEFLPDSTHGNSFVLSFSHFRPNKGKWRAGYSDRYFGIGNTPLESVYALAVSIHGKEEV